MAGADALHIEFSLRSVVGAVDVSVSRNTDGTLSGYALLFGADVAESVRDFPVCSASVSYPAPGYAAMFGWTQMVRSSDASGDFETDPIAIYRDVATPFAWYGLRPTLFDAPSRDTRDDMDWECHSFLCISPDAVITARVQAIVGFSWGFKISGSQIVFAAPARLGPAAWDSHLDLLRSSYPAWIFDAGYRDPA